MQKYIHTYSLKFTLGSDHKDPVSALNKDKNNVINTLQGKLREIFDDNSYVQRFSHIDTKEQLELNFT